MRKQRFSAQAIVRPSYESDYHYSVATAFFNQLSTELSDTQINNFTLRVLSMGEKLHSGRSIRNGQSKTKRDCSYCHELWTTEQRVSALYLSDCSKQKYQVIAQHVPIGKTNANTNIYI
ncbi:hypothetical protein CW304_12085 [Bacillus sp. UFRGS-B20]|nr:hypothetical protein CW304_12085 [Bacillus sp. UFRGS-B20]